MLPSLQMAEPNEYRDHFALLWRALARLEKSEAHKTKVGERPLCRAASCLFHSSNAFRCTQELKAVRISSK